ncbi:MAG: hypothetical protein JNM07_10535 [Phycisphaerae bacterium]|nr:hypothetical protein [Phycisphaerae bacterium]
MNQNPYEFRGNLGASGSTMDPDWLPQTPERTSLLAIFSLVLALICFLPGPGVLAAILGSASLFAITSAKGRLGGKGLAATGIVVGLLATVLWVGLAIGAVQFWRMTQKQFLAPANEIILAIESSNPDVVAKNFSPDMQPQVASYIGAFRDSYKDELGKFQGIPQEFWDVIQSTGRAFSAPQQNGRHASQEQMQNTVPFPGKFEKGTALVLIELDVTRGPSNTGRGFPYFRNIGIMTPTGKFTWLFPRVGHTPPPPNPTPTPAAPDAPTPATPGGEPAPDPAKGPG